MDRFKKIGDLSEKALSQLQTVNKSAESTKNQFKQEPDAESLHSIEDRIKQINEEDAKNSIKEYEELLFIMEAEGIPLNKIPADIHKSIGFNYYRLKRWQNAIDELLVYIKNESNDIEALLLIGLSYIYQKTPQNALEYFKNITAIDSRNAFTFNYWGVALKHIYNKTKDSDCLKQAIEKYQKAAEIKPGYYDAIHNCATALEDLHIETNKLDYLNQSIKKYEEAINIRKDFSQPHFNFCSALIFFFHAKQESSILDDALMHGKKVLELDPNEKNIYYNIACVYSLKEMKNEMLKSLKEVIEFDSKHKKMAREDKDFEKYREDPDFIALTKED